MGNIQEKILTIINNNIDNVEITAEHTDEDLTLLGMDSIMFIQIVVALEGAFDIEIPDEKLIITEMRTLNKMVGVVSTSLGNTSK